MQDLIAIARELAWPLGLLLAWLIGELGHRWSGLPRITLYAFVGFALAPSQIGLLPSVTPNEVVLLANIGFGLILFETGHRINLKWLRNNPWLGASGLLEAGLTFVTVYLLGLWFDLSTTTTALLAALAMATSPAAVLRVINEQSSSGQVTERLLHLTALNCVLAVFVFKIVVGLVVFGTSGNLWHAVYNSAIVLLASAFLGGVFGHVVPALLRATDRTVQDSTLAFALAVIALVMLTHTLKLSPLLATLTFGLIARDRRIVLNRSQRGFGILGELLTLLLFVFVSATLSWHQVLAGLGMGLALVAGRALAKTVGITVLARMAGMTWRKGLLTSLGMAPLSVFVILLIEQTRVSGVDLMAQLSPLVAAALVLELLGPVLTQLALRWAHEIPNERED